MPLDKFKPANVQKYLEFMEKIDKLDNRWKYHWVDEKHVVNGDCQSKTVRADPLNGQIREILVDGSFREAYTLIATISANPRKSTPTHYHIAQDNGTAAAFTAYVETMISDNWFEPYDVLIMDNAAIHTGGEANILEDFLWN